MPKIRTDLLLTMTMTPQFLEQKHDAAMLEKGRGVILASDKGNNEPLLLLYSFTLLTKKNKHDEVGVVNNSLLSEFIAAE